MSKKKNGKKSRKKSTISGSCCPPGCCSGNFGQSSQGSACCCGVDSSAVYSCENEPYAGKMKTAVIDFLFLDLTCCDRCQGTDQRVYEAYELCKPVLAACGYNLVLNQIDVEDESVCKRFRFESSPTIRVNGVDICPSIEENDCDCCKEICDADVKCRLFPFNGKHYEMPPSDMIVSAIINTVIKGIKPQASSEPYKIPENLKGFFKGKRSMAKKKGNSCCCGGGESQTCCCGDGSGRACECGDDCKCKNKGKGKKRKKGHKKK